MILRCTCTSRFQDDRYGPGMRVHNPRYKDGFKGYRCTVCLNTVGGEDPRKAKGPDKSAPAKGKSSKNGR